MRYIILTMLLVLVSCQKDAETKSNQSEKQSHTTSQTYPITFSENWTPNNSEIQGVDFVILYKDRDDNFRENINLMTEKLRPSTTLTDYTKMTIDHLQQIEQKEILSQSTSNVNGQEARILEFKANLTGLYLYYYQQYMIVGDTSYVLTFSSDIDDAEALLPEVKEIFSTFKVPD